MDGKSLTENFLSAIDAPEADLMVIGSRKVYEALDRAALDFVRACGYPLTNQVTITTVEGLQAYDLPPDFVQPLLKRGDLPYLAKYDDGESVGWPYLCDFQLLFLADDSSSTATPSRFAIIDRSLEAPTVSSGTATAAGDPAGGICRLVDSTADFSQVQPRDLVRNTTTGGSGLVLERINATTLDCALFPQGLAGWSVADSYQVSSAAQKQLWLPAPAAVAGHSLTLLYCCRPNPVFADLASWRLLAMHGPAIADEAAFQYQARTPGLKPNPALHAAFLTEVREKRHTIAREHLQRGGR